MPYEFELFNLELVKPNDKAHSLKFLDLLFTNGSS